MCERLIPVRAVRDRRIMARPSGHRSTPSRSVAILWRQRACDSHARDRARHLDSEIVVAALHDKVHDYYHGQRSLGSLNLFRAELMLLWDYVVTESARAHSYYSS